MQFSISKFVLELLKSYPEQKFTAREIGEWIMQNYPKAVENKRNNSTARKFPLDTDTAMLNQIVAEIGSQRPQIQKKHRDIKTTEGRPRQFYYSLKSDDQEILDLNQFDQTNKNSNHSEQKLSEADLYPLLANYLGTELSVYSKRIDERRSKNKNGSGGNKWLYPDLVGMEDLSANWHPEIKNNVKEYADKKTKLWSFEVKLIVNRSNVREAYFQAVSNSTWANFGYLVAANLVGDNTLKELRVLSGLHGIGFIKLDIENINESQILIPSKERSDVDWDTANRLAEENTDFVSYIQLVLQFYQTGDARPNDWDHNPSEDFA
ncbi:HrgA protein [Amylibacter kogurei]|uniref:HrgA protein n=1 Tax=Paramylibacter kogurei TaxID=1889778 RepID=A0A2G5K805_9RHOB|nr:HrgA protein [Amylibacter kogurei]PIB24814.1 HrgA protein [Amylibacter kogurei]